MVDYNSGEKSSYNEAEKKMERLHKSQQVINTCRLNLLHFDINSGLYHYQIVGSELLSLLAEVRGKMDSEEKKKYEDYRLKLTLFFDLRKIFEVVPIEGFSSTRYGKRLNEENWKELRTMLFQLEDFTRDTLDLRGFSSFNVDDDDDDAY